MSRLAVKSALQRQLLTIQSPIELEVYTQLPRYVNDNVNGVVFMTFPDSHEIRLTLRGMVGSQKKMTYTVQLHITWTYDDPAEGGEMFDKCVDKIDYTLRQYQKKLPEELTDPEDGVQSQLVYVSENISTRVEDPQLDETTGMGLFKFVASKQIVVEEWISE